MQSLGKQTSLIVQVQLSIGEKEEDASENPWAQISMYIVDFPHFLMQIGTVSLGERIN